MNLIRPVALLFALNLIDAVLTLYWVRNGIAEEGNRWVAILLDAGDLPFLAVKLTIGILAAAVLIYGSNYKIARLALTVGLSAYLISVGAHIFTALAAYGYLPRI